MTYDELKKFLNKRYYFDLTKYPEIFRTTYWGGFSKQRNNWEIADNRNKFVEDYKIIKYKGRKAPNYITNYFENNYLYDHPEIYESKDNYVLIVSTYITDNDEEERNSFNRGLYHSDLYKVGWEKIYKLYTETATTFVKVVPKRKRIN